MSAVEFKWLLSQCFDVQNSFTAATYNETCTSVGKTCNARILQWINNPKEWHNKY